MVIFDMFQHWGVAPVFRRMVFYQCLCCDKIKWLTCKVMPLLVRCSTYTVNCGCPCPKSILQDLYHVCMGDMMIERPSSMLCMHLSFSCLPYESFKNRLCLGKHNIASPPALLLWIYSWIMCCNGSSRFLRDASRAPYVVCWIDAPYGKIISLDQP